MMMVFIFIFVIFIFVVAFSVTLLAAHLGFHLLHHGVLVHAAHLLFHLFHVVLVHVHVLVATFLAFLDELFLTLAGLLFLVSAFLGVTTFLGVLLTHLFLHLLHHPC